METSCAYNTWPIGDDHPSEYGAHETLTPAAADRWPTAEEAARWIDHPSMHDATQPLVVRLHDRRFRACMRSPRRRNAHLAGRTPQPLSLQAGACSCACRKPVLRPQQPRRKTALTVKGWPRRSCGGGARLKPPVEASFAGTPYIEHTVDEGECRRSGADCAR